MKEVDKATKHPLKKILGVSFGIAVVVGGTIGVGILRNPGEIATILPHAWLILLCWFIGGLYILLAASSYAELTTMLPKAGGSYNYIKRAFGGYPGFISGWFDYISNVIPAAYFCIVIGEYLSLLIPELTTYSTSIGVCLLTVFTLFNAQGVKEGSMIQQVTTAVKILLFLILIAACFLYGVPAHNAISQGALNTEVITGSLALAVFRVLQLSIGTYDGWVSVAFFAEENADPAKTIPRSYFFGAFTVMVLYVLINAAMLYVLPVSAIAHSKLPVSDAARIIFGEWGATFITVFALLSLVSILNTYMMIPSRILFGLSRDGYFIKQGTIVNKGGTPIVALVLSFVLNFLLILFSSFDALFSLSAFMAVGVTGMAYASVIRLRQIEPNLPRPYRAWGYPYSTGLTILVTLVLLIGFAISDQRSLLVLLIILALSYPSYLLLMKNRL